MTMTDPQPPLAVRPPESPLASIYREIEAAISAKLYYLALAVSVSLPDICATLEGHAPTSWKTYKQWFRDNASGSFANFGADECYELRCGVVHNARFMGGKAKQSRFDKLIFMPAGSPVQIHDAVMSGVAGSAETVLIMDASKFCEAMIAAARAWEVKSLEVDAVQRNMNDVVRLRPLGIDPWASGLPVIA